MSEVTVLRVYPGISVGRKLINALKKLSSWNLRIGVYDEATFSHPVTLTLHDDRTDPKRFEGIGGGGHINERNHLGNLPRLTASFFGSEYDHEPGVLRALGNLLKVGDLLRFDASINDNGHLIEAKLHNYELVVRVLRKIDGEYHKIGSFVMTYTVLPSDRQDMGCPFWHVIPALKEG